MNVKIVRLITSEEIICDIESHDDYITCIKPIMVGVTDKGLQFIPWFISTSSETFNIKHIHVLTVGDAIEEIKDKYIEITGGIVIPDKKILTAVH